MTEQDGLFDADPGFGITKRCNKCSQVKPIDEFDKHAMCKGGYVGYCKGCRRAYDRVRTARPDYHFKRNLWVSYRLRMPDYDGLIEKQLGRCAICVQPLGDYRKTIHVDHDHACNHPGKGDKSCRGCVRGILCQPCNTLVGWVESRRHLLDSVLLYLGEEVVQNGAVRALPGGESGI